MLIHIVFSTKNRQRLITGEIEPELYAHIGKVLIDECESPALIMGGDKDHIYLLIVMSRTYSMVHIIEMIKKCVLNG